MKFLNSKLNVKDFNNDAYMENIKNYENISLINNDFKKTKSDECLSDVDYKTKYKTNENIKNENDNLFIVNLL